jgi:Zn-dependent peptidase ImmA (M78 family)
MELIKNGIDYKTGDEIRPCNLSKSEVEDYAQKVADAAKFEINGDLAELVKMIGGRIHYYDLDELVGLSGSIYVHAERDLDIVLPSYTSPTRDRFTISHEVGHYFLHSKQGENPIIAFRQGSTRIEWEANWFAAALLMPGDTFKSAWITCKQDLAAVAFHFGVSENAARVRKEILGLP